MKQRSLPLERPQVRRLATVRTPSGVVYEFHDWTELGPPLPFETIPAWLRLPGEPGYLELDRYMRLVSGVKTTGGGAG